MQFAGGEYSSAVHTAIPELAEWIKPEDFAEMKTPIDFLGVNYYHHLRVKNVSQPGSGILTGTTQQPIYGFTAYGESAEVLTLADGLRRVLRRVHHEYGVRETIITENGFNRPEDKPEGMKVHDQPRIQYLRDHLISALQAIREGCNLTGFCVWTFMDNFEWAQGYSPRMGLIYVDYTTQKRIVKDSGWWYSQCAQTNEIVQNY
jgi:beta-glucosidase